MSPYLSPWRAVTEPENGTGSIRGGTEKYFSQRNTRKVFQSQSAENRPISGKMSIGIREMSDWYKQLWIRFLHRMVFSRLFRLNFDEIWDWALSWQVKYWEENVADPSLFIKCVQQINDEEHLTLDRQSVFSLLQPGVCLDLKYDVWRRKARWR